MAKRRVKKVLKTLLIILSLVVILLIGVYFKIKPHIENQAAHNSKILCSAHFVSKRQLGEAFANSVRVKLPGDNYRIDENGISYTSLGVTRRAVFNECHGCTSLPKGKIEFKLPPCEPTVIKDSTSLIRDLNKKLQQELATHFNDTNGHVGVMVIQNGKIIAEKYSDSFNKNTKFESWSMGKSLTATLVGRLIEQNRLSLNQKAPIEEWSQDSRANITIANLLNMSSGLQFSTVPRKENGQMDFPKLLSGPLPNHIAVYSGISDVFAYSINTPSEFEPNSVRRYRNCDPLALGAIVRKIVEADGEEYLKWPQKNLFDHLGTNDFVLETDTQGNFILSGFDYGTTEAWGKLGMLYLNKGEWDGKQLLPKSFVEFVQTPVSIEENSNYGGLFWLNANGRHPLPKDAFSMNGDGGQYTFIIPSYNAVIVRFGHVNTPRYRHAIHELFTLLDKHLKNEH